MIYFAEKVVNFETKKSLTLIELIFDIGGYVLFYEILLMIGMCHGCYALRVKLVLTEVHGTVENPMGTMLVPLCKKCRE